MRTDYQLTDTALVAIAILAGSAVLGMTLSIYWAVRRRRVLNFPTLLLANYTVAYLGSGVAHLAASTVSNRGFFDASSSADMVLPAAVLAAAGLLAIWAGLALGQSGRESKVESRDRSIGRELAAPLDLSAREKKFAVVAIAILLPIGLYAAVQIQGYSALINSERIISLPQGMARYSILSQWLVWVISLVAMWHLSGRRHFVTLLVTTGLSLFGIFAVVSWTGGRSVALVLSLPMLAVLLPRFGRGWLLAASLGGIALVQFVFAVSSARTPGQVSNLPIQWLDWQWGRWSMLVYGMSHQGESDFPGSTFVASLLSATSGIWRMVGVDVTPGYSMSAIAGSDLLGRADLTYIVPGFGAELVWNFGFLGFLIGFGLVGFAVAKVDSAFVRAASQWTALIWAYIGTLLTLRLVITDLGIMFSYLAIGGLPLLVGAFVARRRGRSDARLYRVDRERSDSGSPWTGPRTLR